MTTRFTPLFCLVLGLCGSAATCVSAQAVAPPTAPPFALQSDLMAAQAVSAAGIAAATSAASAPVSASRLPALTGYCSLPAGASTLTCGGVPAIDSTGQRVSLTTAGYTVPATTDLVRLVQTGTVASATIALPSAPVDGQSIQFVNYAGAITAATFSPAVNGFANGSTFSAPSGMRIRWDAVAAAWYREQ